MRILYSILAGIIGSLVMGVFLKWAEHVYDVKVYTLLLNIDFVPVLNQFAFPELVEFLFHTVISIVLVIVLYWLLLRFGLNRGRVVLVGSGLGMLVGIPLYPITLLSTKTPDILSLSAIGFWLVGHFLFGLVTSVLFLVFKRWELF